MPGMHAAYDCGAASAPLPPDSLAADQLDDYIGSAGAPSSQPTPTSVLATGEVRRLRPQAHPQHLGIALKQEEPVLDGTNSDMRGARPDG